MNIVQDTDCIKEFLNASGAPEEKAAATSEMLRMRQGRGALNGALLEAKNAPSDPRAWGESQFSPLDGRCLRALTDTAL